MTPDNPKKEAAERMLKEWEHCWADVEKSEKEDYFDMVIFIVLIAAGAAIATVLAILKASGNL